MNKMTGQNIYFLGIGGIGMSALARFFHQKACLVSGYDKTPSPLTRKLEEEGIKIHYEDDPSLITKDIDLVILTPAIPADSRELAYFRENNIRIMKRAEVLGDISRANRAIAVAGTHGKTTVTSMITHLLNHAGKKISAFIGGIAKNINSNVLIGDDNDEYVVMEADEFDRSFLKISPYISIVTSIDADHLDIYSDNQDVVDSFNQFVANTSDDGLLIYNSSLPVIYDKNKVSYGFADANLIASEVKIVDGMTHFSIIKDAEVNLGEFKMQMFGNHNIMNALSAVATCLYLNIDINVIKEGLATFTGVQRRFDIRYKDEKVCYIDDYAHHPEEIKASLKAVRALFPDKKISLVFQPHLFSRTRDFMDEFAEVLSMADRLLLMEIYPAREKPIEGITSSVLLEKVRCEDKCLCQKEDLLDVIKSLDNELIVTMGAGDIDRFVPQIESLLRS